MYNQSTPANRGFADYAVVLGSKGGTMNTCCNHEETIGE